MRSSTPARHGPGARPLRRAGPRARNHRRWPGTRGRARRRRTRAHRDARARRPSPRVDANGCPTRGRIRGDRAAPVRARTMSLRVLICDDQALVRAGFRKLLEARPDVEVVGEAEDGVQAVDLARRRSPDVVLMDIRMPGLDAIEATRRIVPPPTARSGS